jgi:hypothetical protein
MEGHAVRSRRGKKREERREKDRVRESEGVVRVEGKDVCKVRASASFFVGSFIPAASVKKKFQCTPYSLACS